ncbi:MAG: integration host factor, actinobacterial type [Actinomycetota bacterium]|nr:integration host factor, actinobacterial type [Actinomycetota bacterium]
MASTNNLPPMSDEQRADALAKAAAARRQRAEIKALLKTGSLTLDEVFERAETDDIVAGTKVFPLLASMPRMGKIKAKRLMEELGIAENRKIRGLGSRQRADLLQTFA